MEEVVGEVWGERAVTIVGDVAREKMGSGENLEFFGEEMGI